MNALFIFIGLVLPSYAGACTSFKLGDSNQFVMAKSYDWSIDSAAVMLNKRKMDKASLVSRRGDKPARWQSRFASFTVNQHGRELPISGLNEAGLAVEVLWLNVSEGPDADSRPSVNELQWIQYQLDNFETVAEMQQNLDAIRISKVYANVHYFACDATGACATFEPIEKKWVVHAGSNLAAPSLTNDTYSDSADYLKRFSGFGGTLPAPSGSASLARFARASMKSRDYVSGGNAVEAAFEVLQSVFSPGHSQFQFVHEIPHRTFHFRTAANGQLKHLAFADFANELGCRKPVLMVDVHHAFEGKLPAAELQPYSESANRTLVKAGGAGMLPDAVMEAVISYPDTLICRE